jgi:hypothetical protein
MLNLPLPERSADTRDPGRIGQCHRREPQLAASSARPMPQRMLAALLRMLPGYFPRDSFISTIQE